MDIFDYLKSFVSRIAVGMQNHEILDLLHKILQRKAIKVLVYIREIISMNNSSNT